MNYDYKMILKNIINDNFFHEGKKIVIRHIQDCDSNTGEKLNNDVIINVSSQNQLIHFIGIEKHVPNFMKSKSCSDDLLFEIVGESKQVVAHIFEHKRTLNMDTLIEAKQQIFQAAMLANLLSGILNFNIIEFRLYCGYRFDDLSSNISALKYRRIPLDALRGREKYKKIVVEEFFNGEIKYEKTSSSHSFNHIKLDEVTGLCEFAFNTELSM